MATTSPAPRNPMAGGVLIAVLPVIGALIGLFRGEATIGFLIGLAIGVAVALAIWWRGRG